MGAVARGSTGAVQGPGGKALPLIVTVNTESAAVETATVPEAFAVNGLATPGAVIVRDVAAGGMTTGVTV
jgi:hypothetical protein